MMGFSVGNNKLLTFILVISLYICLNIAAFDCASPKHNTDSTLSLGSSVDSENDSTLTYEGVNTSVDYIPNEKGVKGDKRANVMPRSINKSLVGKIALLVASVLVAYAVFRGVTYLKEKKETEKSDKETPEEKLLKQRGLREKQPEEKCEEVSAAKQEIERLDKEVESTTTNYLVEDVEKYRTAHAMRSEVHLRGEQSKAESLLKAKPDIDLSDEEVALVREKKQRIIDDEITPYTKLSNPATMELGCEALVEHIRNVMEENEKLNLSFLVSELEKLKCVKKVDDSEKERIERWLSSAFTEAFGDNYEARVPQMEKLKQRVYKLIDLHNLLMYFAGEREAAFVKLKQSDKVLLEEAKEDQA